MYAVVSLLLIGAGGSATRQMVTEPSIAAIVGQIVVGGAKDAWSTVSHPRGRGAGVQIRDFTAPTLTVDGESRIGVYGWGEVVWRIVTYAVDWRHGGSVEYRYQFTHGGYFIIRRTKICDGCLELTTDIYWVERVPVGRQTVRVPIHVCITLRANDTGTSTGTEITGCATGVANVSAFRCPVARRIAERQASKILDRELMGALVRIEQTGRGFYAAGELPEVVGIIGSGIRTLGVLRR